MPVFLQRGTDLSKYKKMSDAHKLKQHVNQNGINYDLAGKYSVKTTSPKLTIFKAFSLTLLSCGSALMSKNIRENWHGRKIVIVYIEEEASICPKSVKKASEVLASKAAASPTTQGSTPPLIPGEEELLSELIMSHGFSKEGLDRPYTDGKLYNYGETQGSQSLRETATKIAKHNPDMMSPSALRNLGDINPQLFRILQFKRLAHAFSLEGRIPFPQDYTLSLIGFSDACTMPMIISSFKAFMESGPDALRNLDDWTNEDTIRVLDVLKQTLFQESFKESDVEDAMTSLNQKTKENIISLSTGFSWHVTQSFYVGDYFIHANRGYGRIEPGFDVYHKKNQGDYTSEAITDIANRHSDLGTGVDIYEYFRSKGWNRIFTFDMSDQKTGNCAYTSIKAGLRFLLSWRYFCKSSGTEHPGSFCDKTTDLFKEWNQFDRELVINDLMIDLRKISEGTMDEDYESQVKSLYQILMSSLKKNEFKNKISPELYAALKEFDDS